MMKFETQVGGIMPKRKNAKPEVLVKIQDGRRRHRVFTLLAAVSLLIIQFTSNFAERCI
jgi:hypothetical protein